MQLASTHSHALYCSRASPSFERDLENHPDLPNRAGLQKLIEHLLRVGNVQLQKLPASRLLVPPLQHRKHRGEQPFKRDIAADLFSQRCARLRHNLRQPPRSPRLRPLRARLDAALRRVQLSKLTDELAVLLGVVALAAENDAIAMHAVREARTPHLETRPRDHLYLLLANALTLTEVGRPPERTHGPAAPVRRDGGPISTAQWEPENAAKTVRPQLVGPLIATVVPPSSRAWR